jgi:hypothetical protein
MLPLPPEDAVMPAEVGTRRAKAGAACPRVGAGFGDIAYSPVKTVAFSPEPVPVQKHLINYEWRDVLCRKGIVDCGSEPSNRIWDDAPNAPHLPQAL